MRAGRVREAEQLYAMASERAPRWGSLHLAWANALWRVGRPDEARQKLRAAAQMDLTAPDRVLLASMINAASR
jgi:predicted Zn-dependent protease